MKGTLHYLQYISRRLSGACVLVGMTIVLASVRVVEDAVIFLTSLFEDKTWNASHVARLRFLSTFISPIVATRKEEKDQKSSSSTCPYLTGSFPIAHDFSERRFLIGFAPMFFVRCIMRLMSAFPSWHAEIVYLCSMLCHKLSFVSELCRSFLQLWGYVAIRTAHFDSFCKWAIAKKDVTQVIIVGAGFDTRAYRFAGLTTYHGVRVVEMDLHHVQWKKCTNLLNALNGDDLLTGYRTLRFVSCDLERDNFGERLRSAGVRRDATTALLLEGVSPYVKPKELRHVLEDIRAYFSSDSKSSSGAKGADVYLLMDYLIDEDILNDGSTKHSGSSESPEKDGRQREAGARWGGGQWRKGPLKRLSHLITHAPEKWSFLPDDAGKWAGASGWKEVWRTSAKDAGASLADHRYCKIFQSVSELPVGVSLFQLKKE
ncbi:hypothetical protein BESB_030160 [Besnoitia besnoiti]|uniref:Methyltransferase n=1 Tax=Besnoitia besnoiti TaxID=94643 RepID=A0A2A9M6Y3_BESBE|nr:hypothetical protein BESB_030160 [Besnoitia besnoiti]PFH31142.1 hypothetical protein BESB_030160 [Besnoitia besnoiti]